MGILGDMRRVKEEKILKVAIRAAEDLNLPILVAKLRALLADKG